MPPDTRRLEEVTFGKRVYRLSPWGARKVRELEAAGFVLAAEAEAQRVQQNANGRPGPRDYATEDSSDAR